MHAAEQVVQRMRSPSDVLRAVMRIYGRLPIPEQVRSFLREGLGSVLPSVFNHISRTINSRAPLDLGDAPGLRDVTSDSAFRMQLGLLMRTLAAHATMHGPCTHVIALPFFSIGGSEATAAAFARVVCSAGDRSVLMLATDRPHSGPCVPPPKGALMINLFEYFHIPDQATQDAIALAVLRAVAPQTIHIINSSACWRLTILAGGRLRRISRLYGSIFAVQINSSTGKPEGYAAEYMERALPELDRLLSDNANFFRLASEALGTQAHHEKFLTVYNAAPAWPRTIADDVDRRLGRLAEDIASAPRLQVLWAGRFDYEKRPDLLVAAAKARPDIDFHVYGRTIVDASSPFSTHELANVHVQGPFSSAADAAGARAHHVMMFTSLWEGMPNVLLEFGSLGVPIIAATLGGVGELIDETTGIPLPSSAGVTEYIAALDRVRSDPKGAAARASRLRAKIAHRHTHANFEAAVRTIPGYLDDREGGT